MVNSFPERSKKYIKKILNGKKDSNYFLIEQYE